MIRLPLHPRLGRLLLRAKELGCPGLGCDLAALVSERDIFRTASAERAHRVGPSDILERLEYLHTWRNDRSGGQRSDAAALKAVERVGRQLKRLAIPSTGRERAIDEDEATTRLLLAAYPDRLARPRNSRRTGPARPAHDPSCRSARVDPQTDRSAIPIH